LQRFNDRFRLEPQLEYFNQLRVARRIDQALQLRLKYMIRLEPELHAGQRPGVCRVSAGHGLKLNQAAIHIRSAEDNNQGFVAMLLGQLFYSTLNLKVQRTRSRSSKTLSR
jgi:hypothetical protein